MAQMTDAEFEAWLAQHGGEVGRKDVEEEVDDPEDTGPLGPGEKRRQVKRVDRTEITAKDGATITVRRLGGSLVSAPDQPQYDVTATTPPKPSSTSERQPPKEEPNPSDPTRMRRWNPQTNAWEDAGANQAEIDRRKKESDATTEAARQRQRQEKADADAAAARNAPKVTLTQDGTQAVIVDKDGNVTVKPTGLTAPPKPGQIVKGAGPNGEDVQAVPGPDGRITYQPIAGATPTGAALPADAPRPSGRIAEAAADLTAFDEYLDAKVRSTGTDHITTAQADKLREARRAFWATALDEQKGIVNAQQSAFNAQTGQRATTLSDLANRRGTDAGIANAAGNDLLPLATKLGSGGAEGLSAAIRNERVERSNFTTMGGGNRMVPEVQMGPALSAVNGMQLPGGTMPNLNVRPNAIGLGNIGSVQAPGSAAPATARPAPIFRPQPPVAQQQSQQAYSGLVGPSTGAVAPSPAPAGAAPQPAPAAAPNPNVGQPGDSIMMPAINAATGEPTGLVPLPSSAPPAMKQDVPPDTSPIFQPGPHPIPVGGGGGMVQMAPSPYFLAGSSRGYAYDPTPSVQGLINDPTIDNEAVRQAVAEMYPGYDIDSLLRGAA